MQDGEVAKADIIEAIQSLYTQPFPKAWAEMEHTRKNASVI